MRLRTRALTTSFLTATALTTLAAAPALAQVEVITVTATKKEANAQDIPVAVNAVSAETIDDLEVGNFNDYVRYLPNVNFGGRGPGHLSGPVHSQQ